jgi:hypothetical protein
MTEILCVGCLLHNESIRAITVYRGHALCATHVLSPKVFAPALTDDELRHVLVGLKPSEFSH